MKKAFTLAEVLITLTIIGIIAALTVPTLMKNHQKREMETRFTQFYSLMTNSLKLYMQENGCSDMYCAGWTGAFSSNLAPIAEDFALTYFKPIHVCSAKDSTCLNTDYWKTKERKKYKALDGGSTGTWHGGDGVCETAMCSWLPNGMRIGWPANGNVNACTTTSNHCSYLNVDLNGNNGPNRNGYDIFYFSVNKDGTITSRSTECSTSKEASGRRYGNGCASRIIKNGWKIDYWE